MPTYEYRCTRCGHQFEVVHPVAETVERCERCGGSVRRVFSPPALIFKGPGFHVNDYRKTPVTGEGDGKVPAAPAAKDAVSGSPAQPKPSADSGSGGSGAPSSPGAGSKSS